MNFALSVLEHDVLKAEVFVSVVLIHSKHSSSGGVANPVCDFKTKVPDTSRSWSSPTYLNFLFSICIWLQMKVL